MTAHSSFDNVLTEVYSVQRSNCYFLIDNCMLTTIAIILIVLWLVGVVTSYTLSGFIHILLVVAIVLVLLRVIRGENPFKG